MTYFVGILLVAVAGVTAVRLFPAARPPYLGVRNGRLPTCPDKPNCVCSQSSDPEHQIAPIPFDGTATEAMESVKRALREMPRITVVTESDGYLHAEARSWLFQFVDDVEFWYDASGRVIHVRSASRVGHSDLGVNRDRVESLRGRIER